MSSVFSVRRPCSDFTDMLWRLTNRRIIIIIIIIAICHRRKFGQVWGSTAPLPEVVGKLRCRRALLWTFDYHTEKSESFCDVTLAAGWLPEGTFYVLCIGKIGQNPKIGQIGAP